MKGRKPKAPGMKVVRGGKYAGSAGQAACSVDESASVPAAPAWLSEKARREWDRIAPALVNAGAFNDLDQHNLSCFCQAYALYQDATQLVNENGAVVGTPQGGMMKNPAVAVLADASRDMRAFGGAIGLDPISRGRLGFGDKKKPQGNPFLAL